MPPPTMAPTRSDPMPSRRRPAGRRLHQRTSVATGGQRRQPQRRAGDRAEEAALMRTAEQRASRLGRQGRPGPLDLTALLRSRIRDVPDWPNRGVLFKDITPLLADPVAFGGVVRSSRSGAEARSTRWSVSKRGVPARGARRLSLWGGHRARVSKASCRSRRTPPPTTWSMSKATLEVHQDAFPQGIASSSSTTCSRPAGRPRRPSSSWSAPAVRLSAFRC